MQFIGLLLAATGGLLIVSGVGNYDLTDLLTGRLTKRGNAGEGAGNNPGDTQPAPGGGSYVIPGNPNGSTGRAAAFTITPPLVGTTV